MQKLELVTQLVLNRLRNQIELERRKQHQTNRQDRTDNEHAKEEGAEQQRQAIQCDLKKGRPLEWSQVSHG